MMTTYCARMMDASTGGEGFYEFEDGEKLLKKSPMKVIKTFMEHAHHDLIPGHYQDYELNAAFKNSEAGVVTGMGSLILTQTPPIPFMIMISAKRD